nr:hypothetical protein [Bacteroides caccae]
MSYPHEETLYDAHPFTLPPNASCRCSLSILTEWWCRCPETATGLSVSPQERPPFSARHSAAKTCSGG